jgi:hypothetical protein
MTAAAPTALDRYRAAKLALDTFDAFTKRLQGDAPRTFRVTTEASITAATKHPQASTYDAPTYVNGGANQGFSRFCADWIMTERLGLAAEYRATLVEKLKAAKFAADAEARALLIENPPT